MIDRKTLGARLRDSREYLGLSQDEVARVLNLPRPAISLIESGQRRVEALELAKLADLYQRPLAEFTDEVSSDPSVPTIVQHLARTASKLTENDQAELLRFAQFLTTKNPDKP